MRRGRSCTIDGQNIVAAGRAGALLVADDVANVIWRVTLAASKQ